MIETRDMITLSWTSISAVAPLGGVIMFRSTPWLAILFRECTIPGAGVVQFPIMFEWKEAGVSFFSVASLYTE